MNQENPNDIASDTPNAPIESVQEPVVGADAEQAPPTADDAQAKIEQLQAQVQQLQDDFLRAQAQVQNTRRRAEDDVSKARKFGIENFAESLLPVLDSLQAGLAISNATAEQLREGTEATLKQLVSALERNQVVAIAPAVGDKFNPHHHQAISVASAPEGVEVGANCVVSVMQQGYLIADRVLRPAMVVVTAA